MILIVVMVNNYALGLINLSFCILIFDAMGLFEMLMLDVVCSIWILFNGILLGT